MGSADRLEAARRDFGEAMAAAHDVPADEILVFDQSRQSRRISANVSGLGPTIRISLNDNLLERTSEEEIVAVMGHELGHYVLGHGPKRVALMLLVTIRKDFGWFSDEARYRRWIVAPASLVIGLIGVWWTIERTLLAG